MMQSCRTTAGVVDGVPSSLTYLLSHGGREGIEGGNVEEGSHPDSDLFIIPANLILTGGHSVHLLGR